MQRKKARFTSSKVNPIGHESNSARLNGTTDDSQLQSLCTHCGTSSKSKPMLRHSPACPRTPCNECELTSANKMIQIKTTLYPEKQIGHLPGVDVGQQFGTRAEIVSIGLHGNWSSGVDCMSTSYANMEKFKSYTFPLALSIIMSWQYEDGMDNEYDVIYTSQGGTNLKGNLKGSYLALKNNVDQHVPVRLIRSQSEYTDSMRRWLYTYDGLYEVVKFWAEKGTSGFTVFKFGMKRLEGQPPLTINQAPNFKGHVPKSIDELCGLVCRDISGGQEAIPIPATNLIDDPPVPPTGFRYCKSNEVADNVKLPIRVSRCGCEGTCTDPSICSCAKLNGADFPYVPTGGGRLVEAKSVMYECGPKCGCKDSCVNKTSQQGIKYRFEVFRTPNKGWALRSWDFIPAGSFICEYAGLLMRTKDIDNTIEQNYIFDIDCLQTMNGLEGRERRIEEVPTPFHPHITTNVKKLEPEFCVDAGPIGNVGRFINHSCDPNLFVQCVLSSHLNIKLARVMLFAAENIPPLQELACDYGYPIGSVLDADGNVKEMACHCGASICRGRLF
ncbi:histone-lysine N-methyltransferase, H3 lysine-9 specific SUVH4-like [Papaver somniferum]|uniref:histone-lysine N-methyltransferase, H3 lysine-9 specific SUVH4-like n=1 Tax=Papaver somniferum TaxID=3469 RepID=UPI000E6FF2B7|nr:histone-lysine N-methyltransferase, H3 lysine-9 specific SUVH4-like [Papaver somniferum]